MIMKQPIVTASLFALTLLICPQAQAKDETTVREFLTWGRSAQDSFLTTSIITAAVIATQIRADFAACIGKWYTLTNEGNAKRQDEILAVMEKYPDSIPSGIVVAVLQKECGNFGEL